MYVITGAVSGVNYGPVRHGQIIPVHVSDIVSRIGLWLCPETSSQFTVNGNTLVCPEYDGLSDDEIIAGQDIG